MNPLSASLPAKIRPALWLACFFLVGGPFVVAGQPGTVDEFACFHTFGASLERNCLLADLDGDGKPDSALIENRSGLWGARVTISVRLSGNSGEQTFSFENGNRAYGIRARDLDGDQDIDLVLTRGFRQPVTVLLNNGNGTFTLDPNGAYCLADADDDVQPGLTEPPRPEHFVAAALSRSIPLAAVLRTAEVGRPPGRTVQRSAEPARPPSTGPANSAPIRAP